MDNENRHKGKGPYSVKEDGTVSDREVWEFDPETENKFDNYLYIKAVNREAKKESARRQLDNAFESLMGAFGEDTTDE